ncbi:MAG: hypothetical protein H3C34_15315 [Caldilineaceae bacterium]|nr:hypothetical protein [Caldilineaceae bacterium]
MQQTLFPPLPLDAWRATRDAIHAYARVIGQIRRALTPPQKHWWHVSLRVAATGLTTTPVPAGEQLFEALMDFTDHHVHVRTSRGQHVAWPMAGQALAEFCDQAQRNLSQLGVDAPYDETLCAGEEQYAYDRTAVTRFWQAFTQVDAVLKKFRHGFRGESSPVQLWPHHLDLAVVWFSGRLVPGQEDGDPEHADEQMNFGFSTGDEGLAEPYFYAMAYPTPDGFVGQPLPDGARWFTEGFTGAVLPYSVLVETEDPRQKLLAFLRAAHEAGASLMGSRRAET